MDSGRVDRIWARGPPRWLAREPPEVALTACTCSDTWRHKSFQAPDSNVELDLGVCPCREAVVGQACFHLVTHALLTSCVLTTMRRVSWPWHADFANLRPEGHRSVETEPVITEPTVKASALLLPLGCSLLLQPRGQTAADGLCNFVHALCSTKVWDRMSMGSLPPLSPMPSPSTDTLMHI